MTIPPSLLSAIIHATGRSLAERVAADAAKALLQSEEATQALRDEIEKAVDDLDLRDLAREEVQRVVEHDVDVDVDELVRDVVTESISVAEVVIAGKQAVVTLVGEHREAVVQAAGTALAEAVVAGAAAQG